MDWVSAAPVVVEAALDPPPVTGVPGVEADKSNVLWERS